ncbi:MAG TPA: CPBP family intramembrane glutamic endopeptidase [Candidatus Bathyarchaeia archaeon]|nr:CPBP family intramembrane glutamic endopeptidase [Candidatus Bathyarchaeia archaeon]
MSGLESDVTSLPTPPDAVPPRPFFHTSVTWLTTALVAILVGYVFGLSSDNPLEHLTSPEHSLERLAGRDMELRSAVARAKPWERHLYNLLSGGDDGVDDWIRWHEELAQSSSAPDVELDRLILLGEAGRTSAIKESLEEWEPDDEAAARRKEWAEAAYLNPSLSRAEGRALVTEVRDELPAGWFSDALVARLARLSGDTVARQQAEAAIASRGASLLGRWRALQAAGVLLAVAGLASLAAMAWARADPRIADARLLDGLSMRDAYALFIRGALGFLVLGTGLGLLIPDESALDAITGPATVAPILLCALWYVRARGLTFAEAFGLSPMGGRWAPVVWMALGLIGLQLTGETVIGAVLDALHLSSHWADGLQENLIWGSWGYVARETVDSVIWAPLGEEVAFRGVLYAGLRSSFGVAPAAAISSALFAIAHGYGVLGFVAVFWSGAIWALAYERTGSLWPGIIAHGAGNLMATAGVITLLRI